MISKNYILFFKDMVKNCTTFKLHNLKLFKSWRVSSMNVSSASNRTVISGLAWTNI